jgi:hypothetical protein
VAKLTNQVGSADSLSALAPVDSADSPVTSPVNSLEKLLNRPDVTSSDVRADLDNWRTSLLKYLRDPSAKINKDVRRSTFKYVLHNDELYQRTVKDLLLKCIGSNQARVAMGEVHEDICSMHQLVPKMKWLLHRVSLH